MTVTADPQPHRRAAMAVLAQAPAHEIAAGLAALGPAPAHAEVRPAETGLVMVRGRTGGDGAPFNLGEATVTRCAVQLATGEIGFGYVLGRDRAKARLAALADALWQNEAHRPAVEREVLSPRPPPRVLDALIARRVVHEDDHGRPARGGPTPVQGTRASPDAAPHRLEAVRAVRPDGVPQIRLLIRGTTPRASTSGSRGAS